MAVVGVIYTNKSFYGGSNGPSGFLKKKR